MPSNKPEKWKDLEARGVRRCYVAFTSGKRCRRRAHPNHDGACEKHGPILGKLLAPHIKAIREQPGGPDHVAPRDSDD